MSIEGSSMGSDSVYAVVPGLIKDIDTVVSSSPGATLLYLDRVSCQYLYYWYYRFRDSWLDVAVEYGAMVLRKYKGIEVQCVDTEDRYIAVE